MKVKVKRITNWKRALNTARLTINKNELNKEPSEGWKDSILYAEHSPIREVIYEIKLIDIPSFVSTHLVRHHEGCEKYVVSNREDRSGNKLTEINRLTPVSMIMTCNAQALINISRKRLCNCASKETRQVWEMVKDAIQKIDPTMSKHMIKECVYRGFCPEMKSCGFSLSPIFKHEVTFYRTPVIS